MATTVVAAVGGVVTWLRAGVRERGRFAYKFPQMNAS